MTERMLVKPVPEGFLDQMIGEGEKLPAFVWRAAFASRLGGEGEFSAQLGRIGVPTLIVWGDRDARYSRTEQEALLAAIPKSQLVVYEGAGHLLPWEEPERFAADVVAFVERLPTPAGS